MSSGTLAAIQPSFINSKTSKLASSSLTKISNFSSSQNDKKEKNKITPGLPFNFLSSIKISQENQPQKCLSSSLKLPNLDKLNIGSKKIEAKNGGVFITKDARSVLVEINKASNILPKNSSAFTLKTKSSEELSLLASKIRDNHSSHFIGIPPIPQPNEPSSLRENNVKNLLLSKLDLKNQTLKNNDLSFLQKSYQKVESHLNSTPTKKCTSLLLEAKAKAKEVKEESQTKDDIISGEKVSLVTDPTQVSSFGCAWGYKWRPLNSQPLKEEPPKFWDTVSKLYSNFDSQALTAYELQKKEEERRLQKDWKKNKTINRTKKERPSPSVDPFARTGTYRFQFKGGSGS